MPRLRPWQPLLVLTLPLLVSACDDPVAGSGATLLNVEGVVREMYISDLMVPGAEVVLQILGAGGEGRWAADSTDADGRWALQVQAGSACEGVDSLVAVRHASALDYRATTVGAPGDRPVLACDTAVQTLELQLYREVFRTPQPVAGSLEGLRITAGRDHACATGTDGAHCWGDGDFGRVGNPVWAGLLVREPVRVAGEPTLVAVDAGVYHTCGLDTAGTAWCWGDNLRGALGIDTMALEASTIPVRVDTEITFTDVAVGENSSCALSSAGVVYCWGALGRIGTGGDPDDPFRAVPVPTRVLLDGSFVQVSSQRSHTCALRDDGAAFCWGFSYGGELGGSESPGYNTTPLRVEGGIAFATIDVGALFACGLDAEGAAYCWGRDYRGRMGLGDGGIVDHPAPMAVEGGHTFAGITAGWNHSCAWTADGAAWCWGDNVRGEVGAAVDASDGCPAFGETEPCVLRPMRVAEGIRFSALAGGSGFTCGIATNASLYCWGTRSALGSGRDLLR